MRRVNEWKIRYARIIDNLPCRVVLIGIDFKGLAVLIAAVLVNHRIVVKLCKGSVRVMDDEEGIHL